MTVRAPDLPYRQGREGGEAARLADRHHPGGARPHHRHLDGIHPQGLSTGGKRVYYLSLEFLIGRLMRDAVSNMGLMQEIRDALSSLGVDIDVIAVLEPDAALGNGGLGRLAACFMESMATVDIPAYGYGIRYVHGLFRQQMADGWQVELPESWLAHGNPWEFERRESSYEIGLRRHGRDSRRV
jgi:starch phosphorylase